MSVSALRQLEVRWSFRNVKSNAMKKPAITFNIPEHQNLKNKGEWKDDKEFYRPAFPLFNGAMCQIYMLVKIRLGTVKFLVAHKRLK